MQTNRSTQRGTTWPNTIHRRYAGVAVHCRVVNGVLYKPHSGWNPEHGFHLSVPPLQLQGCCEFKLADNTSQRYFHWG